MSCESCTGCFEATPCSAPSPSLNGHVSKEYRHFLKAARICRSLVPITSHNFDVKDERTNGDHDDTSKTEKAQDKEDHAFNTMISVLANNQFTAQTYLAQAYKQLGPGPFLDLARTLAHHGFWGRLITWAFLYVKENNQKLQMLLEEQDTDLSRQVNDEAEMFELFNPTVHCQRIQWNSEPIPRLEA
ncbi:hypothetical protein EMPS_04302 [Entomortierella parvispora]|uniref:Uncharacterized protein n=1 Tax=Entomortierella parvispora TaxID=205924 RepID=A0A9P3H8F9_9FUNG|nr:hypothetical protein EMPS_04302 [Entomortierella parvispora]